MPRTTAADKNIAIIDKYVKMLKDMTKVSCKDDLENIFKSGYSLAKVIKNLGSCRLEVVEQNGNMADVRISPSVIQMIKREGSVNEIVLIDGGFVKAKIPTKVVLDILPIFEKCGYELPTTFLAISSATEDDDIFDHEEDEEEDKARLNRRDRAAVAELDVDNI